MGTITSAIGAIGGVANAFGGAGAAEGAAGAQQSGYNQAAQILPQAANSALNVLGNTYGNASSLLNQYYPVATGQLSNAGATATQALNNAGYLGQTYLQGAQGLSQAQTQPGVLAGYGALDALSRSYGLATPTSGSANLYLQQNALDQAYNTNQQNNFMRYNDAYNNYLQQQQAYNGQVQNALSSYGISPGNTNPNAASAGLNTGGAPTTGPLASNGVNGGAYNPTTGAQPYTNYTSSDAVNKQLQDAYTTAQQNYKNNLAGFNTALGGVFNQAAPANGFYSGIPQAMRNEGLTEQQMYDREANQTIPYLKGLIPGQGAGMASQLTSGIGQLQGVLDQYKGKLVAPVAPPNVGAAPIAPTRPDLAPPPTLTNVNMTDAATSAKQGLTDFYNSPIYKALYGNATAQNDPGLNFLQTPGYQFQLDQAKKAANASASAGGFLNSPNLQAMLTQYGQGLANQTYNDYLSKVSQSMQGYQQGLANMAGLGMQAAGQQASIIPQLGTAQANLTQGIGSGLGSTALSVGSGLANLSQNQGTGLANIQMGLGNNSANVYGGLGSNLASLALGSGNAQATGIVGAQNANQNAFGNMAGVGTSLKEAGGGQSGFLNQLKGIFS